jgi:hypothetical protein
VTVVTVIGWIALAAGVIVLLAGVRALCGELMFRARWKWGDAHKLKRSVRLGWNTGTPPEGVPVLVREYADELVRSNPRLESEHGWAIMTRKGDRCYSINGGFNTPVTNVTGWLCVVDGDRTGCEGTQSGKCRSHSGPPAPSVPAVLTA